MKERVSDFARGERVKLTKECHDIRYAETFSLGETGVLGRFYRLQDGLETWELILDQKRRFLERDVNVRIAVHHTDIERY